MKNAHINSSEQQESLPIILTCGVTHVVDCNAQRLTIQPLTIEEITHLPANFDDEVRPVIRALCSIRQMQDILFAVPTSVAELCQRVLLLGDAAIAATMPETDIRHVRKCLRRIMLEGPMGF